MSVARSRQQLRNWCADPAIDVVISTGGTGLTGRDVTVEAHRDVYEKEIDAFGTVFTIVSMNKIGTSAVQSRATGGVRRRHLSVCAARQSGRLQGCLGRDPVEAARLSPPAVQFRGNIFRVSTNISDGNSRASLRMSCHAVVPWQGPRGR